MLTERKNIPDPFSLVIFGASGDLTHRKLIPAVYSLFRGRHLPDAFRILGFARRDKTDQVFRAELGESVRRFAPGLAFDDASWADFARRISYHRADFADPAGFRSLADLFDRNELPCNRLYYLAVQPDSIVTVIDQLCASGLSGRACPAGHWARLVVEKPFGSDLASARALNQRLRPAFREPQVFRIDHYLGKETVQNLLVLRFANSIFEPIWNQKYVDHVQVTVAETIGIEGRGRYYEQAGALRDIVQNHVMHLLSLVAMEPPGSLDADDVRDEKVKVLSALRPIPPECRVNGVVRAQYAAGRCAGADVPAYIEEPDVPPDSHAETFVAFKTFIDNWRWAGVPFYVRTGKRLAAHVTEVSVHFKAVPQILFNMAPVGPLEPNVLAIRIQPDEGISLRFQVKVPGPAMQVDPFQMDFGYADAFGREPPDAYERLLLDAALGDATLFTRYDEVEAAWAFVDPVLAGCGAQPGPLPAYPAGSWGPKEADALIEADGRNWLVLRRTPGRHG